MSATMGHRAASPGKVVLSGAYSVLEGAPAIVAAVDRFVIADADRPSDRVTEEVAAAIAAGLVDRAPWFDASALRGALPDGTSYKLGLGSSAAILVASICAAWRRQGRADITAQGVFAAGFAAHRAAQGGGSGVDVAASTFGGVLRAAKSPADPHRLEVADHALPAGVHIAVLGCAEPASTSALVARVFALRSRDPRTFDRWMKALGEGAMATAIAPSPSAFLAGLRAQNEGLFGLGEAAGAPIVTDAVRALDRVAANEGALFMPSGAGGGDIAIFAGEREMSEGFRRAAESLGHLPLDLRLGAPGVLSADPGP